MRETSSARIPNFLVAGEPKALRRLMLLNNLRLGREIAYQDIGYQNGKWYAWFYEDASTVVSDEEMAKLGAKR